MPLHSHQFVEEYDGLAAFGFDRETDERTVIYYLQKFSDDTLMKRLVKKMSDEELEELFDMVNRFLKKHLNDQEYHSLFLKDDHHH
ncbi:Cytoplasmic protein [Candidatus Desulfarcum epimagneticum]|uniref:Cytoplasmic protein n=1 Tax=uncultured Desulfobacteraceae bacterium TaxID=218296 RepID=A0A484HNM1_9BACT|nr:Cytoplasmic protein [uncultured Desulfobacteraceae bacterium]